MNVNPWKMEKHEQFMLEDIYGLLNSLCYVIKFSYHHASSQTEINDIWKTHDMIKQASIEYQQISPYINQ